MVWALILLLVLSCPTVALADEDEEQDIIEVVTTEDFEEYQGLVNQIEADQNVTIDTLGESVENISDEITQVKEDMEIVRNTEVDFPETIKVIPTDVMEINNLESEPLRSITSTCYATLTNNSSGANYLSGMLPKLGWNQDYVAWQDTNASYILAYGQIEYENGTFTSTDCEYVRYYRTNNTSWLYEYGSGTLNLDAGNYGVLSSLGDYPILGEGQHEQLLFYQFAIVLTLSIYAFRSVFSFLLRTRS